MWTGNSTEELCLIDSGITDLNKAHLHANLQVVNLHCNQISRITNLVSLQNLKHLDLSSNRIRVIEGLDGLTQLRTLNLSSNQIENVEGFENLRSLVKLNLSYNHITNVSGLQVTEGPNYKLSHVELHGNCLVSSQHVARCLEGAVNLRRLSLTHGGADNPCCNQQNYRQILLQTLSQVQVLDGMDRHGNPIGDLDILADIPGLEQYMEFLVSESSTEMNVASVITPKIDAAMNAFKHRQGSTTPEVSISATSDLDTSSQSHSTQQGAASSKRQTPQTEQPKVPSDHVNRLEKLELQMLNLLKSSKETMSEADTSTQDDTRSKSFSHRPQHTAKRDIDETDESEEDKRRSTSKQRAQSKPSKTSGVSRPGQRSKVTPRQRSPVRAKTSAKGKLPNRRAPEGLVVRGRSPSPPSRSCGVDADTSRVRTTTQSPTAFVEDEEQRDDVRATYVQIMRELETERERRWKAEQASKKLVEHIKELQIRGKEEENLQCMAVQATTRLKEGLMNEREAKLRLQADVDQLQEEVSDLANKLKHIEKSERNCQEALRAAEETSITAEKERLQQQAHEAKKLQEATLKAAAASREVDILRNNVKTLKGQVQQMQELLATREQEHRHDLKGRYTIESKEFQDALQRQLGQTEKLHGKQTDHLNQRIDQLSQEYGDLENEFRTALQIEGARFQEVQRAYERVSQDAAEHKQMWTNAQRKEEKTSTMTVELTALVKEQKGRITELSKAKQEQAFEHKGRIQELEGHLEEARRRMVTMELLKQEKTKLQAQLQAQTSLIEGLRTEKKVWGEELMHQESSLAQDRGRMEAKIEALTTEVSTLKKHLEREADAVRIKAKMVDDQTETIRTLKEGIQERDSEIKKVREETLRLQRDWEDQLAAEASTSNDLQEKLDRTRERKDELKHQLAEIEDQLEDSKKAHSVLNRKWKEKSSLIGQLEQQVTAMKKSWEGKERKLTEERTKAVNAASLAVEKLRSIDDAFRKQLDSKEESCQKALQELETEKQAEIDLANKRVLEVEEEMRELLRESDASKRAMEDRVKKLTRAFTELQHDLF